MHKCPHCKKEFDQLYTVPVSGDFEPFVACDPMKGIQAYGIYDAPKTLLCHQGAYVHFAFLKVAEVQPADAPEGMVWMVPGEERLVKMEQFDPEYLAKRRAHHAEHPQACEHEGCGELGIACYYNLTDEEPEAWYCADHCHAAGFCWGCGYFNAGFESFDFSKSGLCAACEEEYAAEFDDDDDDDDLDDWYDEEGIS